MKAENKEFYTTTSCNCDNTYKVSEDMGNVNTSSSNLNGDDYTNSFSNYSCMYLLPCGLCERTGKTCPKHSGGVEWGKFYCKPGFTYVEGDNISPFVNVNEQFKTTANTENKIKE